MLHRCETDNIIHGIAVPINDTFRVQAGELLDLLPDLVFGFSENGSIDLWNDGVPEVTGYSETALAGMTTADLFDAGDAARVTTAITDLFEVGSVTISADIVTATGERISYELNVRRGQDDSPLAIVGIGRDVTGRTGSTQERNEIIDRIADGFFAVDTDWRVTHTDQKGKQLVARAMDPSLHETTFEGLHL